MALASVAPVGTYVLGVECDGDNAEPAVLAAVQVTPSTASIDALGNTAQLSATASPGVKYPTISWATRAATRGRPCGRWATRVAARSMTSRKTPACSNSGEPWFGSEFAALGLLAFALSSAAAR